MANIARLPKSGNEWTPLDLLAYNIRVVFQDSSTFFGTSDMTLPGVHGEVLTVADFNATKNDDSYTFLRSMNLAMSAAPGEESAVADFVVTLFRILRYTGRDAGRVIRTRKDLSFWMCGQERHAEPDVCVVDSSDDILLLVQDDKRHLNRSGLEAQLIAGAIAAFSHNNENCVRLLGLSPITHKVILGITMAGTMPTFYWIPVTDNLVYAVQHGEYPARETVVFAHLPQVPRPTLRNNEGMGPLDNRRIILSCLEAFKRFL